jgi:hypothetical protein
MEEEPQGKEKERSEKVKKTKYKIIGLGESPRMGIPSWMMTVVCVRLRSPDSCRGAWEEADPRLGTS